MVTFKREALGAAHVDINPTDIILHLPAHCGSSISVRCSDLHDELLLLSAASSEHQAVVPPVNVVHVIWSLAEQQPLVDDLLRVHDVGPIVQGQNSEGGMESFVYILLSKIISALLR